MEITPYTRHQLAANHALEQLLYWHFTHVELSCMKDFLDGITGRKNLILLYAGWSLVLVAREHGQVVGWAAVYGAVNSPHLRSLNVFVSSEHRLEGVGSTLVEKVVAMTGECLLEVEDNAFFRRLFPWSYATEISERRYIVLPRADVPVRPELPVMEQREC